MKSVIKKVTGLLLLLMTFLPAGAFAAENQTSKMSDTIKNDFLHHVVTKSIDSQKAGLPFVKKKNSFGSLSIGTSDIPVVYETEPNDDPASGYFDYFPLGYGLIGTMNATDYDFHQIQVTKPGTLFLAGNSTDGSHTLGFALVDSNLQLVTTANDIFTDPSTGLNYEVMQNLQPGIYYVFACDVTNPSDSYDYNYEMYAQLEPNVPVVNTVRQGDNVITGTSNPGNTIIVTDGAQTTTTGQTDLNGSFSVSITPQKTGSTLTVQAYDPTNDTYSMMTTVTVTTSLDTTPPAAPQVNPVNDHDKIISGSAEYGSTVTVKYGSTSMKTTANSKTGIFQFNINPIKAGTVLSFTASDEAGNTSKPVNVTVADKTPPSAPKVNAIDDNDTTITGKAEAYSTITIKSGSTLLPKVKADKYGNFKLGIKPIKAGTKLYVTATDSAKNTSATTTVTVLDKTPPSSLIVNSVYKTSTYVSGKSEAGAFITVKVGSSTIGSGKVDSKGSFKVKIKAQKSHTVLTIFAKDAAGNYRTIKVTVK